MVCVVSLLKYLFGFLFVMLYNNKIYAKDGALLIFANDFSLLLFHACVSRLMVRFVISGQNVRQMRSPQQDKRFFKVTSSHLNMNLYSYRARIFQIYRIAV